MTARNPYSEYVERYTPAFWTAIAAWSEALRRREAQRTPAASTPADTAGGPSGRR